MKFAFKHQPSYTLLDVTLAPGDSLKTEAGAMVFMDPGLRVETSFGSGILSAVSRKFLGGESLFINTYTAADREARLGLSSTLVGDIAHRTLSNETMFLQSGSFLASSPSITVQPQFGGIRSFFGGEGLFLLKVSGSGDLFYSSYGAILPIEVDGSYVIDTGHIVAFDSTLTFNVKKVGGWKSTLLSGEGFVCEFTGKGRVLIQTRVPENFIGWLSRYLPS